MHHSDATTLFESLPVIVFETDDHGRWTQVNPQWLQRTGQAREHALGTGWLQVVHADDRAALEAQWQRSASARQALDLEFRVAVTTEPQKWFRALAAPAPVGQGFVGVIIDSTRRRTAEAQVSRLDARNEALLSALPDMLFRCNRAGRFIDFRGPRDAPHYVPPEHFLGMLIRDVLPPDAAEPAMSALERAATTRMQQRYEYRLLATDFESRVTAIEGDEFLFVIRDVSAFRRMTSELVAARETALEASRLKSQFLANVSHEIRTPLNGILGVTQLLRTMALPADAREYLDVLQGSGQSLLDIVNDVLDLSKIEANRLELESEIFDVEQLVSSACRSFMPQAAKKPLALEYLVSPAAAAPSRGDPARLRQVINNLVGNAGEVRVRVDRDGETLSLEVADTGPGIPADRRSAIFEPFVQGDGTTSRRFGGTGLGLTICRRLVQLMGGDITLKSELGVGSTFRVRVHLPSVVIDRSGPARPNRPLTAQRPMRVLLAEDNLINARLTCAIIEKLGHQVQVVTDGQQALDALGGSAFDLVLMDVQMPVVDGLEATRRIRKDVTGAHRHVPIVALTANAMRGDDLMCLSAGMDAYLPKPVAVDALKDMLVWFGEH